MTRLLLLACSLAAAHPTPEVLERTEALRAAAAAIKASPADKDSVRRKLAAMSETDQFVRGSWLKDPRPDPGYNRLMMKVDRENTAALKALLEKLDWLTIPEFGEKADADAWLIAQHADLDKAFQKDVLERLKRHYLDGGTNPGNYAFLFDRVAVGAGKPQRFGTQGGCKDGRWVPEPIEQPKGLERRRAEAGLPPESFAV